MIAALIDDSVIVKIVDWMISNQGIDHSAAEIAEGIGARPATVTRCIEKLKTRGVVICARKIRHDELYVLDLKNAYTKAIMNFSVAFTRLEDVAHETATE